MSRIIPIQTKTITSSSKKFIADKVSRAKKPRCCVKSNAINRQDHKAIERNLRIEESQMTTDKMIADEINKDIVQEPSNVKPSKNSEFIDEEEFYRRNGAYGYYQINGRCIKVTNYLPR